MSRVNLGGISTSGDAGYSAGVINHEMFVHAENYAKVLAQWEDRANTGMTSEQFKSALNALQTSAQADKEHEAMQSGKVTNFVNVFKEINNYFNSVINSNTATGGEVKEAKTNQGTFNESSQEDCPDISNQ